jgi:hypothetical protein
MQFDSLAAVLLSMLNHPVEALYPILEKVSDTLF